MPSYGVNSVLFDYNLLTNILERASQFGDLSDTTVRLDEATSSVSLSQAQMQVFKEYLCKEDQYSIAGPEIDAFTYENPGLGFSQLARFEPDDPSKFVQIPLDQTLYALPQKDSINKGSVVAIDFGTSSTVVAFKEGSDVKLLRLGVEDWTAPSNAEQFENPTLFQIEDNSPLQGQGSWSMTTNRPSISLHAVKHANMAKRAIRDVYNDTGMDPQQKLNFTFSIIDGLKSKLQTEENGEQRTPLFDAKQNVMDVGFGLTKEASEMFFDAIEYYAWLIGRNINLHFRGYFSKYYLSYPVAFTTRERERLRESFERGLMRSLPPAILYSDYFRKKFEVKLFKPEPIAFAASVLGHRQGITLDTSVSNSNQVFAIFDVGGGTSDFFYGKYRVSTGMGDEEEDDFVLESYKRDGLALLGGEHLLHYITALIFEANQETFVEKGVDFELPASFRQEALHGVNHLFNGAFTTVNKLSMMQSCRHLLTLTNPESSTRLWQPTIEINLMTKERECPPIELEVPYERIYMYLREQFETGVTRFLSSMGEVLEAQAGSNNFIHNIKIIRSGNTCRSLFLQKLFTSDLDCEAELSNEIPEEWRAVILEQLSALPSFEDLQREAFKDLSCTPPRLDVLPLLEHRSLQEVNPPPNLKTGTAIGLLKLVPGGGLMHIDEGEERFELHMGRKRVNSLVVAIPRELAISESAWVPVMGYHEGGVAVYFSDSPKSDSISIAECSSTHVEVGDEENGHLWARAVGSKAVEFAVSPDKVTPPSESSVVEMVKFGE